MKKTVIFFLLNLSAISVQCQIDLEQIKALTSDSTSGYFYDTLLNDFLERPHSFEMTKAMNLYYGKLYSRYYEPYSFYWEQERNLDDFLEREDYHRAITIGERILAKDPVNFSLLLKLLQCYLQTKNEEMADHTRAQVDLLHKAMLHSGSGEHEDSAIKVISISDEYAMMALLQVKPTSRRAMVKGSSIIDFWKVRPAQNGGARVLYFEVLLNKNSEPENR